MQHWDWRCHSAISFTFLAADRLLSTGHSHIVWLETPGEAQYRKICLFRMRDQLRSMLQTSWVGGAWNKNSLGFCLTLLAWASLPALKDLTNSRIPDATEQSAFEPLPYSNLVIGCLPNRLESTVTCSVSLYMTTSTRCVFWSTVHSIESLDYILIDNSQAHGSDRLLMFTRGITAKISGQSSTCGWELYSAHNRGH